MVLSCSTFGKVDDYTTVISINTLLKTPWTESASELYRPSDLCLSAKLVPTFADRGCQVVSVTDPYGSILGFLDRSRYCFFQVAPQLYSQAECIPSRPTTSQKI
jgi:hypothetical protein